MLPRQLQQRARRQERLLQRVLDWQVQGPRRCAVDDIVHVPAMAQQYKQVPRPGANFMAPRD